ncbi:ubiquitin-conjugating enzyme E2 J1-like [Anthonomus grandis grandis]|uniref:ubiquitin-conjugating enzyme E2 J1-like n=1 Tax=Anthonomus grandis grandis TaxID=2921223 RepID=UPI0021665517|nr:ubiquitin-conjugating enzyme E2 J1-like [Anthonomus grandis grandis]
MPLETQYNLRSPGVKRLMREAMELASPTEEYYAAPLDDNLFEWHFTVRGPPDTEFDGGYYHGRILLPPQYPMQPPNIILLTPNGRFETNKKICLSISGYHPESWQPSWSIRTALLALIAFMPTKSTATIGALDYTKEERQALAKKSKNWSCSICGTIVDKLLEPGTSASPILTKEESSILENVALKAEEDQTERNEALQESNLTDASEENKTEATCLKKTPRAVPIFPNENEAHKEEQNVQDSLRQRNLQNTSEVTEMQNTITDEILRASIQRSKRDRFWTCVIIFLVFIIVVLILRRMFFM